MGKRETITFLYVKNILLIYILLWKIVIQWNPKQYWLSTCNILQHTFIQCKWHRQILIPFSSALSHFSLPKFPLRLPLQLLCLLLSCGPHTQKLQIKTFSDQKRQQQLLQNVCWLNEVCHPPIQIKKKTSTFFYVTSDCMGCATRHFRWKIKKTLKIIRPTFILQHIWLYEVCHPPVQKEKKNYK